MNRLRWLSLLMIVTILGVAGFQAYWLKENYDREKNSLQLRSQFHFREAMLNLQVAKLNLPGLPDSAMSGALKFFVNDKKKPVTIRVRPHNEVVSTINVIRDRVKDSLVPPGKPVVVSLDKTSFSYSNDSMKVDRQVVGGGPNEVFRLLYGVDSLQDSIRINEIDSALRVSMAKENISVPFTIKKYAATEEESPRMDRITLGIRNPVTYELSLGNSFSYLIKKITLPILFSLLLLGITITSFILLYRNFVRQKKLAELKAEFISNVTHELKTPIATVGVAIEALKNFNAMDDPGRTKEYLDISSNELQRLNLLVDKVLKLSMFEKKEMGLKIETIDLGEVIDEVTSSLRLQFEKQGAAVEVKKQGDLHLEGDRLHLLSVVYNLLDNALKYSSGSPEIEIDASAGEGVINLRISDRGIGIPREYRSKIFEKFFRVPHGNLHNAKGYGLGLSYVSQVVKKHGGSIEVEERGNGGTIFTVTLPKKQV